MNKNAIKDFAINARNKLRVNVINKLFEIGITEDEIKEPLESSTKDIEYFNIGLTEPIIVTGDDILKREKIVRLLENYSKDLKYKEAFDKFVEEVAYTWFNRLIAIRFMEVNDHLPSRIRVLSSEEGSKDPDILRYPFSADIEYSDKEVKKIQELQDSGDFEELYKFLFLKQSRELGEILPFLFNPNSDYLEMLFPFSYSNSDSILNSLISNIPEENFNLMEEGQVEILGWLYQFYNSELKDKIFADLSKNKKITAETLPAATQLFTPDWIVKYMIENSVGRVWINHLISAGSSKSEGELAKEFGWKYYVPEVKENEKRDLEKFKNLTPEDLTVMDAATGSGHILISAYDLLMKIYESEGYSRRDAAVIILEKNLFGLDIDSRAAQLASLALFLKARNYNRRIFRKIKNLNILSFPKLLNINLNGPTFQDIDENTLEAIRKLVKLFEDSDIIGSLLMVDSITEEDIEIIENFISSVSENTILKYQQLHLLKQLVEITKLLKKKYWSVVMNPPYLGGGNLNSFLKNYLNKYYKDSKSDLYLSFIIKGLELTKSNGYLAMITMNSWMFLNRSEKLRKKLLNYPIVNMAHLGTRAFEEINGEVVQTTAFIINKIKQSDYSGSYFRLVETLEKEKTFLNRDNNYIINQLKFAQIPGSPIAYWISTILFDSFKNGILLNNIAEPKQGIRTGDNSQFLRLWFEVNISNIKLNAKNNVEAVESNLKWFPYNKGGKYRKWYGNSDYIVNWKNNGYALKNFKNIAGKAGSSITNTSYFYKESISWSLLSSGQPSFRYKPIGFIYGDLGPGMFSNKDNILILISFLNTKVSKELIKVIAPTLAFTIGDIAKLPVIIDENNKDRIEELAKENIKLSKEDWDSFEFSWDFKKHPLIRGTKTIKEAFELWEKEAEDRFNKLKANEEELNDIFIKIYGLEDELTPEVEDKYVSVRKAEREREIKSLISYAVGVLFGRYSLDKEGLVLAGEDIDYSNYKSIIPDEDNIIPILDEEYFEDDIVGLFINFIKTVYGEVKLEENLSYIADALGGRNKTSREIIRDYFKKDFFKDHLKIYQKRPIYWLYSSGRQNGAKALIYMHRYNKETTAKLKADYLTRLLRTYINEIDRLERINEISTNKREVAQNKKQIIKLQKQLKEAQEFNDKISHLADLSIDIDLDDGVKVNYQKVQTDESGKNLKVLQNI